MKFLDEEIPVVNIMDGILTDKQDSSKWNFQRKKIPTAINASLTDHNPKLCSMNTSIN